MGERYHALAKTLLESPDPVTAIAHLIGDHEGRLDALAAKIAHLEADVAHLKAANRG